MNCGRAASAQTDLRRIPAAERPAPRCGGQKDRAARRKMRALRRAFDRLRPLFRRSCAARKRGYCAVRSQSAAIFVLYLCYRRFRIGRMRRVPFRAQPTFCADGFRGALFPRAALDPSGARHKKAGAGRPPPFPPEIRARRRGAARRLFSSLRPRPPRRSGAFPFTGRIIKKSRNRAAPAYEKSSCPSPARVRRNRAPRYSCAYRVFSARRGRGRDSCADRILPVFPP